MIDMVWNLFRDIAAVILLAWCAIFLVISGSVVLRLLITLLTVKRKRK